MSSWFRKKRKALVSLTAAVFISGMFSFFCPHCLAKMIMEDHAVVNHSNSHEHCSQMEAGKPASKHSRIHCNGSCGCGGIAKLTGSRSLVILSDGKRSPDSRIAVLNGLPALDLSIVHLTYTIGRPYKPDRACFSPLERNCVLLN